LATIVNIFFPDFQEYSILYLAQTAFMVWMLVDAYRRQAEQFWYFVIFFIPMLGAWAYFFAVKAKDFRSVSTGSFFQRKVPLSELRYRVEHMPTLTNNVEFAKRLIEQKEFAEAIPYLNAALKQEPDHPTALYNLALCQKEEGHLDQALPTLKKLLARDSRYANYTGWHLFIETLELHGDPASALEQCRELARIAPTLQHQCLLAEHLVDAGQPEEAQSLLDRSLQDHSFAPGPIRRRNRAWANQASRLQKRISASSESARK
jgi:hypothetical protein